MDLKSQENLEQIDEKEIDQSLSSMSDIQENQFEQFEIKQEAKYNNQFQNFGLKVEVEVCHDNQKEFINDVSAFYLNESEREIYANTFKKRLGHLLIMICSRNQITEVYWLNDDLLNKKVDQVQDQDEKQDEQIVLSYLHKTRQLSCLLRRVNDQIYAIVGQTDGKILFIDPISQECRIEIQFGDNIVDFFLEKHYLIFINKSKLISVLDILTNQVVASSQPMQLNSSQNCLEIIERNNRGIKFASGNKSCAVQIWSLLFQKQIQMESQSQEQNVEMKYLYKLDTLSVWNLTVDCLRYFKNTQKKNWRDIEFDQRNFDSTILASGGSFYDSTMKYAIQIFNWKTKQLLRIIENGHRGWVNSLKFFNDQSGYFIVGSADKNTTVYSSLSGQIVKRFEDQDLVVMHALRLLNLNSEQQNQLKISTASVCILGVKDQGKLFIRLIF